MENSSFGRLISVLTSPTKTFESIRERPTWLIAFLVLCLAAGTTAFLTHQRTDYMAVSEFQLEQRGQEVPAEQLEGMVQAQEKIGGYLIPIITPLMIGLVMAIVALLYWVGCKLGGGEPTYKQMFAVGTYAGAPGIIAALLQAIVILPKKVLPVEQIVTRNLLPASNLGMFAPDGASSKLVATMAGLDFFVIWGTVLTFIGLKVVGRVSAVWAGLLAGVVFLLGLALRVVFA